MTRIRKLRRSQTITPFGVGSVIDYRGESFVTEDTSQWRGTESIDADRVCELLGIAAVHAAKPAIESYDEARVLNHPGTPFSRFPAWLFCSSCRRLDRWSTREEKPLEPATCRNSACRRRQLIPMRFVMVCGNGHMDDVEWRRWAHSRPVSDEQRQCRQVALRYRTARGRGGGLESLEVRCDACDAFRNLAGIAGPGAARSIGMRCRGKQPWEVDGLPCDVDPMIVQKGASNVHFPSIYSAIDIPPWSDADHHGANSVRIRNDPNYTALKGSLPNRHPMHDGLVSLLAQEHGALPAYVEGLLAADGAAPPSKLGPADDDPDRVLVEEWKALISPRPAYDIDDRFVAIDGDLRRWAQETQSEAVRALAGSMASVTRVTRLREIRVFRGFQRYDQQAFVPADLGKGEQWLPGLEIYGEGIFIRLDEDRVGVWENDDRVGRRMKVLGKRRGESFLADRLPAATPRFVLIHTLAHLLIRQLVFDTGFASASLRERLYVRDDNPEMAGLLVYTSAGDAEGSMGGLARQGFPEQLMGALSKSLLGATWCSLDPVCAESGGQGTDSLSLAACHGCCLVAETSCVHSNVLLDRLMVTSPEFGFYGEYMDALMRERRAT